MPITLCLTMGGRPDHLRRTLDSLLPRIPVADVIAVNDFRDEATNTVFREHCPQGHLILHPRRLGHHRVVDRLYACVQTPFVLHCEDDWLFDGEIQWDSALELLRRSERISQVCFRRLEDFGMEDSEFRGARVRERCGLRYARLDQRLNHWHGYTFNPHLASIELWRGLGGFRRFRSEWHLSRALRRRGRFVAYQHPGACVHIGADLSMASPLEAAHRFWPWNG